MKTIIAALLAAIAATALADTGCDLIFEPNPTLPRDCVELMVSPENAAAYDCLFHQRGVGRPDYVDDIVQVAVFIRNDDGGYKFVGWSWMTADECNYMHEPDVATTL